MLKGDLTRFSPGDLISFLVHLNQEGILTVSRMVDDGPEVLNLSFRDGRLTTADSDRADAKVLGALLTAGLIDADQYEVLAQARIDTGLPLSQILDACEVVEPARARESFEMGYREVVFQLFTWESGDFQFTEVALPERAGMQSVDATALSLDAARQVDEYREYLSRVEGDCELTLTEAGAAAEAAGQPQRYALDAATAGRTLTEALAEIPLTSFEAMEAVQEAASAGWIRIADSDAAGPDTDKAYDEDLLAVCGDALIRIRTAADKKDQISELLAYCRGHFESFLLLALRGDRIVRCRRFLPREPDGAAGVEVADPQGTLSDDAAFRAACESGRPFFGRLDSSPLLSGLGEAVGDSECAIVPLGRKADESFLLYAPADAGDDVPDALRGLQFLFREIQPRVAGEEPAGGTSPDPAQQDGPPSAGREVDSLLAADAMVAAVNELPSMPHLVSKVLQMLSDPDSQVSDLVQVLARDPSLVARLIRVSNSALYGRGQETTSLDQAVVRLGANTVRSLVTAASMRSIFPLEKTNVGIWGQGLWQHSIECGLSARRVAQLVRFPDPEEAFVAGVLHDIGKVVILLSRPDDYGAILKERTAAGQGFTAAERQVLGFDHTEVGDLLLQKWQMPTNLQACVLHHHDPDQAGEFTRLAHIVALGNTLSHGYGSQTDGVEAEMANDFEASLEALGLGFEQLQGLEAEMGDVLAHSEMLV